MEDEKFEKQVIEVAKAVVPKGWHVFAHQRGGKPDYDARLNVHLWIYPSWNGHQGAIGQAEWIEQVHERWREGMPDDVFLPKVPGRFRTEIRLYSYNGWKRIVIHELAHVLAAWISLCRHKGQVDFGPLGYQPDFGEPMHGATFQRAYKTMINRLERVVGDRRVTRPMLEELEEYARRYPSGLYDGIEIRFEYDQRLQGMQYSVWQRNEDGEFHRRTDKGAYRLIEAHNPALIYGNGYPFIAFHDGMVTVGENPDIQKLGCQ